jgi:hypothetical protein
MVQVLRGQNAHNNPVCEAMDKEQNTENQFKTHNDAASN